MTLYEKYKKDLEDLSMDATKFVITKIYLNAIDVMMEDFETELRNARDFLSNKTNVYSTFGEESETLCESKIEDLKIYRNLIENHE